MLQLINFHSYVFNHNENKNLIELNEYNGLAKRINLTRNNLNT